MYLFSTWIPFHSMYLGKCSLSLVITYSTIVQSFVNKCFILDKSTIYLTLKLRLKIPKMSEDLDSDSKVYFALCMIKSSLYYISPSGKS